LREAPHLFDILARSAPSVPHGFVFVENVLDFGILSHSKSLLFLEGMIQHTNTRKKQTRSFSIYKNILSG